MQGKPSVYECIIFGNLKSAWLLGQGRVEREILR